MQDVWELFKLSLNFFCKSKTVPKSKVYLEKKMMVEEAAHLSQTPFLDPVQAKSALCLNPTPHVFQHCVTICFLP